MLVGAMYNDGTKATDVTGALANKIADAGAKLNIPVNSKLIPVFSAPDAFELSQEEEQRARAVAILNCGGENVNATCFKAKFQEYKEQMLEGKAKNAYSTTNTIDGPYLRIAAIINNKLREFKIPEGQAITMDSLQGRPPTRNAPFDLKKTAELGRVAGSNASFGIMDGIRKFVAFVGPAVLITIGTALYVVSILVAWVVFGNEGYRLEKFVATAIAVLVPLSGFFITPLFFGLRAFVLRMKPVLDAAAAAQKQSL